MEQLEMPSSHLLKICIPSPTLNVMLDLLMQKELRNGWK